MHKNKLANFFIAVLVVIIAVVVIFFLPKLNAEPSSSSALVEEVTAQTLNLQFDLGDSSEVLKFNDVEISNNENLFNVMKRVTEQNNIEFSYKDFGGDLGVFIKSINSSSQRESKTKWWQYWINGEYAQIGVSSYQVKSGDNILFRFTDSQTDDYE